MRSSDIQSHAESESHWLTDVSQRQAAGYLHDLLLGAALIASQKDLTVLARLIAMAASEAAQHSELH